MIQQPWKETGNTEHWTGKPSSRLFIWVGLEWGKKLFQFCFWIAVMTHPQRSDIIKCLVDRVWEFLNSTLNAIINFKIWTETPGSGYWSLVQVLVKCYWFCLKTWWVSWNYRLISHENKPLLPSFWSSVH